MITPQDIAAAKQALGAQLAELRRAAGHNQHALAKRMFLSRSSIANIERGRQLGTRDFWQRCDEMLHATGALVRGYEQLRALENRQRLEAADAVATKRELMIHRAVASEGGQVTAPDAAAKHRNPDLDTVLDGLRAALTAYRPVTGSVGSGRPLSAAVAATGQLHEAYQRADYGAAARLLPAVLDDVQALVTDSSGTGRQQALHTQAVAYIAASKLASKAGDGHLAWLAADRAAGAAQLVNAAALSAVAAYQAACALLRLPGKLADAEAVAVSAAEDIDPHATAAGADLLSARGSLLLLAALITARRNDRRAARRYLAEAASVAEQLGRDGNHLWTGFGPTNVVIHRISVAVALGRPAEAASIGETVDTARLPSTLIGRRTQVHLDLAAACAQRPDTGSLAVLHLLEAERVAPQTVYVNAAARSLLASLLGRERRAVTPGLRPLAARAGVAA